MSHSHQGCSQSPSPTESRIGTPTASTVHHFSWGSISLVRLYASMICRTRPQSRGSSEFFLRSFSALMAAFCWAARALAFSLAMCAPGGDGVSGLSFTGLQRRTVQPSGPVRRTDQRTGQHAWESDLCGLQGQLVELVRGDPAVDRMMPCRRTQVLRDGDQFGAGLVQVVQGGGDFFAGLAHAQDQVRLGDQLLVPRPAQHLERAVVAEPGTDPAEDPRNGLDVVGEHLGT